MPRTETNSSDQVDATVLVVEDEPSLAETIQYSLEKEGFRVSVAADGRKLAKGRIFNLSALTQPR